jgi:hypothetical protein
MGLLGPPCGPFWHTSYNVKNSPDVVVVVVVVVVMTSVTCSDSRAFAAAAVVVVVIIVVVTVFTVSAVSYKQGRTVSNAGLLCNVLQECTTSIFRMTQIWFRWFPSHPEDGSSMFV